MESLLFDEFRVPSLTRPVQKSGIDPQQAALKLGLKVTDFNNISFIKNFEFSFFSKEV